MRLIGKSRLVKLKKKNQGNQQLVRSIDRLIRDIEAFHGAESDLRDLRPDADCVHNDGFWFFDIRIHRTLLMIEIDEGEATVIWTGNHDEYETTFKNNKSTIEKWLRINGHIA